jgi:hypothetical protein
MKKLALILALLIIPCSAFGLEMLSDTTLDSVTGQAGVAIAADDIQLFINIEKMAWIDCDGFDSFEGKGSCAGAGGAIVLNNFQIDVLNINAITGTNTYGTALGGLDLRSTDCGNIPLFYDYATLAQGSGCTLQSAANAGTLGLNNYYDHQGSNSAFIPHFLTIDVTDRLPASSDGSNYWMDNAWTSASVAANGGGIGNSDIGGVLIGLPTVEIYINALSFTPVYDGDLVGRDSQAINDDSSITTVGITGNDQGASFGTIYLEGITFTVLSGWIEISPK